MTSDRRLRRSVALGVAALLSAGILAACGGDDDVDQAAPTTTATTATTGEGNDDATAADGVTVRTFQFTPTSLTVAAGSEVTFTNEDNTTHTATAGTPDAPGDEFDVELAGPGATGSVSLDEAGTYPYFCKVHPSMTGELVVG